MRTRSRKIDGSVDQVLSMWFTKVDSERAIRSSGIRRGAARKVHTPERQPQIMIAQTEDVAGGDDIDDGQRGEPRPDGRVPCDRRSARPAIAAGDRESG